MSEAAIHLIERLVSRYPGLRPILDDHVSDNFGEVLPHLFFGDLTRYTVSRFLEAKSGARPQNIEAEREVRGLLHHLEDAYADGGDEIQELISGSFLENLPRPGEDASGLRARLGPALSAQLRVIG